MWPPGCSDVISSEVRIGDTSVKGLQSKVREKQVHKFLGIRYAQAPRGRQRLNPPVPAELPLVVDATRFGARCAQFPLQRIRMSEDCLFLNIYTPKPRPDALAPVMVWIHGGHFIVGAGDLLEGDTLVVEGGVVVVTLNYRLGVLGFLSTGDNSSLGNYGLWDQLMALQWVQKYIRHFGGDERRVTLAGTSAGAACVSILSLSSLARDLFRHVIQMSGSASSPWARQSPDEALKAARVSVTNVRFHNNNNNNNKIK